jgi:hypothetical protein
MHDFLLKLNWFLFRLRHPAAMNQLISAKKEQIHLFRKIRTFSPLHQPGFHVQHRISFFIVRAGVPGWIKKASAPAMSGTSGSGCSAKTVRR